MSTGIHVSHVFQFSLVLSLRLAVANQIEVGYEHVRSH